MPLWAALPGEGEKVRRYCEFHYAAKSWTVERRVVARVEAGPQGADSRFIVTNLPGPPKATANQFRLLIHTAAYWLLLTLRGLVPRVSFWCDAQFDTIRLCLIKVAARVTEMVTRMKLALPTAFPYQAGFADLAGRVDKLPP